MSSRFREAYAIHQKEAEASNFAQCGCHYCSAMRAEEREQSDQPVGISLEEEIALERAIAAEISSHYVDGKPEEYLKEACGVRILLQERGLLKRESAQADDLSDAASECAHQLREAMMHMTDAWRKEGFEGKAILEEMEHAIAEVQKALEAPKWELVTHCPYCNQRYQVYDCVIGEKCNKPLKSFTPEDRALIETVQQAFREIDGSRRMGPSWYTKGESGMHQQVSMWIRKAKDALQAMITRIEGQKS